MDKRILRANLTKPVSRIDLVREYCKGKTVLDIGCLQHDLCNTYNANWLHQAIVDVAESVVGVDYLEEGVKKLNERGYQVIAADVTKPLTLDIRFDIIVVGNLIEHLSSFDGLLTNIRRLLKPGGCVLISTANPFYREQYFYSAFKNDIVINPEHTCWIDPVALDQLCLRFGFVTDEVHWVREKWRLGQIILHGDARSYDMFTGSWIFHRPPHIVESVISSALEMAFKAFFPVAFTKRIYAKRGADTRRLLYIKFVEYLFHALWSVYRFFIVSSRLNHYEMFVSALRRDAQELRADDHAGAHVSGSQK